MNVLHTALWVSKIDATQSFYQECLGLTTSREIREEDGTMNWFARGDTETELQFKYDSAGDTDITVTGIDHIAIGAADIDSIVERVLAFPTGTVLKEPTEISVDASTTVRLAFVEDPDGYTIELIEESS